MRLSPCWLPIVCALGCGGRAPMAAYRRAALERGTTTLGCPAPPAHAEYLGGGGVEVLGCGLRQTYTCVATRAGATCAPDGPPTGTYQPYVPVEGSGTDVAREAVASCGLAPGTAITFWVGVDGQVLRVEQPPRDTCVLAMLRNVHFDEAPDAQRISFVLEAAPAVVVQEITAPPVPPPTSPSVDAAARGIVEQRRASILACTNGHPVAVVAAWTASGAVTLHLQDAQRGTPEDGCVEAATAGARIDPPPQTAGSVLHPIQ